MRVNQPVCKHCGVSIDVEATPKEVINNEGQPSVLIVYCPACRGVLGAFAEAIPTGKEQYSMYLPSVDECTYTIHCLLKQESKLQRALEQVHGTITKLEVLRELAKEKGE